ncbi:glycosyltransferase family 4 protein [Mycolicibacterium gilvum]|uniref:glycosyltransferase family 4 protein n=1 Tax=Mycolicibacterium gilvum TaxID=1804 RepID=UPI00404683F2
MTPKTGERPDVALLGLNYPPEPTGIAPYSGALAGGVHAASYRVHAHVAHPHYPEWKILNGYGQWTRSEHLNGVRIVRRKHYVPGSPRGLRRLLSEISFGVRLVMGRWHRPRIVIAVSPSLFSTALAVLRLRLTPKRPRSIVWVQDLYALGMAETGEGSVLVRRITQWVESKTLRAADRIVVIHERFADFVVDELGISRSRVSVIRNWTHLPRAESPDRDLARNQLGWPGGVTLAVHTGNMGAKQGLENIIEAARIADGVCAPVHFILVGDGGERRSLVTKAQGIERLTFVDPLNDRDYRAALAAAHVLIVNEKPGVAAMAVPSKLTSYFDAGRPIVAATDINGITATEVKTANAGVVVPAGDPHALLDAVLAINDDPDAASRYGRNGRSYRDSALDESTAIATWLELIRGTLADG